VTDAEAALLGVVQGLTEFLPVSSDGHLVIVQRLLGIAESGIVFEIVVHVATLVSVLLFYRERVAALVRGVLARQPEALRYGGKLIVATLPAVLAALVLGDFLKSQFESARAAAFGLLVTGAVLWTTRHRFAAIRSDALSWSTAFWMGCAQAIAILPGVSRSGLTLAAALALGVAPMAAAEFSFLMSVAAIAGAAVYTLPDLMASPAGYGEALATGAATALVAGVIAIWFCVRLLRSGNLHWFAYYAWAAGLAMLVWLHAHGGS
jgi:undecaprenyl-diphosphatase